MNIIFKKTIPYAVLVCCANLYGAESSTVRSFEATYQEGDQFVTRTAICRKVIFTDLTGYPEIDFFEEYKKTGKLPALPSKTQKLIDGMVHANLTVGQLRKEIEPKFFSVDTKQSTFSIVNLDIVKYPHWRHLTDIGALQANHPEALFQTASRPNGLEGAQISYVENPDTFDAIKNGVNSVMGKWAVQGEEAQIATILRALVEIYLMKEKVNFFSETVSKLIIEVISQKLILQK